jgi:hypothetical protein
VQHDAFESGRRHRDVLALVLHAWFLLAERGVEPDPVDTGASSSDEKLPVSASMPAPST